MRATVDAYTSVTSGRRAETIRTDGVSPTWMGPGRRPGGGVALWITATLALLIAGSTAAPVCAQLLNPAFAVPAHPPPVGLGGAGAPTAIPALNRASPANETGVPVGVADLGSGSAGDRYTTAGFEGRINLSSFSTFNASLGTSEDLASFQLNAFLALPNAGIPVTYWVQDLLLLNTSNDRATFEDNVWNASSSTTSVLAPGAVVGNGSTLNSPAGAYYADAASSSIPGSTATLSYPAVASLGLNSSLSVGGEAVVRFSFDDGFGSSVFDTVTFRSSALTAPFAGFSVNASLGGPLCPRCYGDVELVAGGPYGGYQTALVGAANVLLNLERWTGHDFTSVPAAVGYGIATAEGLTNAGAVAGTWPGGSPAVLLVPGTVGSSAVWNQGTSAAAWVTVVTPSGAGVLSVNGTSVPFREYAVDVVLDPGTYAFVLSSGGQTYVLGAVVLGGGQIATFEAGGYPVLFVPVGLPAPDVWSVTLGNTTLNGTGTITFGVENGTYRFAVGSVGGYTTDNATGNLTIQGAGSSVVIPWRSNPTSLLSEVVGILEIPVGPIPLYLVIGAFVAAGIVVGLLARPRRRRRIVRPREPPSQPTGPSSIPEEPPPEPSLDELFPER